GWLLRWWQRLVAPTTPLICSIAIWRPMCRRAWCAENRLRLPRTHVKRSKGSSAPVLQFGATAASARGADGRVRGWGPAPGPPAHAPRAFCRYFAFELGREEVGVCHFFQHVRRFC